LEPLFFFLHKLAYLTSVSIFTESQVLHALVSTRPAVSPTVVESLAGAVSVEPVEHDTRVRLAAKVKSIITLFISIIFLSYSIRSIQKHPIKIDISITSIIQKSIKLVFTI